VDWLPVEHGHEESIRVNKTMTYKIYPPDEEEWEEDYEIEDEEDW
jgi:hypothetical protein